jgi:hypothetical protein
VIRVGVPHVEYEAAGPDRSAASRPRAEPPREALDLEGLDPVGGVAEGGEGARVSTLPFGRCGQRRLRSRARSRAATNERIASGCPRSTLPPPRSASSSVTSSCKPMGSPRATFYHAVLTSERGYVDSVPHVGCRSEDGCGA